MKKTYNTPLATKLLEIFKANTAPLSFKEINSRLFTSNLNCNKTSIYRQLETMRNQNIITKIGFSHGNTWELNTNNSHLHLECNLCHKLVCLSIDLEPIYNLIKQNYINFRIKNLNLQGICGECII